MKNVFKLFGIIALAAVIGFSMVGCDLDNDPNDDGSGGGSGSGGKTDPALNGTWIYSTGTIEERYYNGNGEQFINDEPSSKFTYTTEDGIFTGNVTHMHGGRFDRLESRWYSRAEYEAEVNKGNVVNIEWETKYYYTIVGNTLTFTFVDGRGTGTFTRK